MPATTEPVRIATKIFYYMRHNVRWSMDALELYVVAGMIRRELPTEEEYLLLWLSRMDKE